MDIVKQILESFSGTLPTNSKTAAAIARNATPAEISNCATDEGLHALAGALFEASEEGGENNALLDTSANVTPMLNERLREFRKELPKDCETSRLIDAGARLEEISEAAEKEGLTSLVSLLFEAEQEHEEKA